MAGSYLSEFGFSKLKVDGRIVTASSRDAAITTAIVGLGKILNMTVIAEGVETREQLQFLRSCGCDEVQGYLLSRPLDVLAFSEKLRSGRDWAASTIVRAPGLDPKKTRSAPLMESR